jgi:hypothetical protein
MSVSNANFYILSATKVGSVSKKLAFTHLDIKGRVDAKRLVVKHRWDKNIAVQKSPSSPTYNTKPLR